MSDLSRRDCLNWALAAAGALPFEAASAAMRRTRHRVYGAHKHHADRWHKAGGDPESLNGLAAANGLRFGSCIGTAPTAEQAAWLAKAMQADPGLAQNPPAPLQPKTRRPPSYDDRSLRALMVAQCSLLVPENELKWYALRWKPGKFDFARADILVDFAARHGMGVRGHTLLWNRNNWMPPWVANYDFGANPARQAERMLREHITAVCRRYGERIFSYDVINETVAPDTGDLEASVFTKILGPDVIDICFHAAREAAPHAQLVYNDYMSWHPKDEAHRAGVLKLLDRMKKNDVPVDALGLQSHIGSAKEPLDPSGFEVVDEQAWRKFLDEVTAMGLDLVVTEFDVNDRYLPADPVLRDRAVADFAKRYLDLVLSYPQLRYVMAWGLIDRYSWLQRNTPRADGAAKRPCPYTDDYKPAALRDAMAQSFLAAPARPGLAVNPA